MKVYTRDLRLKVLDLLEEEESVLKVSKYLKIPRSTIHRWEKEKREGKTEARIRSSRQRKIDLKNLEKEIIEKADSTLKELAKKFKVSTGGIFKCLKKLGITRKKKVYVIKKKIKKRSVNI